jgi:hypothetical protein
VTYHADIPLSDETMLALMDQQRARGLPTLDRTIAVLLSDALGKSTGPMWSAAEIAGLGKGKKAVLKTMAQVAGGVDPSDLGEKAGTGNATKAYLAHLTMLYKRGKEPLHQWDEATQKYLINPKYRDIVLTALA